MAIEVARSRYQFISYNVYVLDLLEQARLLDAHPVEVSMDPNQKLLEDEEGIFEDPNRYHCLLGKFNYLTITRPNI